ncbi:MAG: DUF559 domain-containing protein [Gemmataceae bacterium]
MTRAKELRRKMTPAERALWQHLRRNQLDGLHFRRQQVLFGFIADFYCHAAGLVIEVDGDVHDSQIAADADRTEILESKGFSVHRVRNEDVFSRIDVVLGEIRSICRHRMGTANVTPKR